MNDEQFDLIKRIVFETALKFQRGKPETAEECWEIQQELERVDKIVTNEATRLEEAAIKGED